MKCFLLFDLLEIAVEVKLRVDVETLMLAQAEYDTPANFPLASAFASESLHHLVPSSLLLCLLESVNSDPLILAVIAFVPSPAPAPAPAPAPVPLCPSF